MGYCERCGGRYDFEGICEGCGTDEEWSWNTPKNQNKVVCKGCGTEIYEVRRHCHVCGRKNEAAFKSGSEYCPKCGNAFENGACPDCGRTPDFFKSRDIKPIDLRYCPVCGEKTSRNDSFCINCGNENYINEPLKEPPKNPVRKPQRAMPASQQNYYKKEETHNVFDDDDDDDEYVSVSNRPNTTLWIILGVLSSIFCCLITGIVTTVFAIKANNAAKKGKFVTASGYVDKAAGWYAFTVIIGVIEIVIGIVAAIFLK